MCNVKDCNNWATDAGTENESEEEADGIGDTDYEDDEDNQIARVMSLLYVRKTVIYCCQICGVLSCLILNSPCWVFTDLYQIDNYNLSERSL